MAKSAAYLRGLFEIRAGDYIDAKQELRQLMQHYGKTADRQAAFFVENGGRAGVMESLQAGLAKVYARNGGFTRFALHLPDSARGRAEADRDQWHDAITRLQRVMELEGAGGDAARLRRLDRAFAAYTSKCRKLARDAANARVRRARQQGAVPQVGHDLRAAVPPVETARAMPPVLVEAVPGVDPNDVPEGEDLRRRAVAQEIDHLQELLAADPRDLEARQRLQELRRRG